MFWVVPLSKRSCDMNNLWISIVEILILEFFIFFRLYYIIYENYGKRTHVKFPIFYKTAVSRLTASSSLTLPKLSSYLDLELSVNFANSLKITKYLSP